MKINVDCFHSDKFKVNPVNMDVFYRHMYLEKQQSNFYSSNMAFSNTFSKPEPAVYLQPQSSFNTQIPGKLLFFTIMYV